MLAVYGNPATTTNSAHELARRAGVTVAEAKRFLKIQASAQVDRQRTKPPDTAYAPTGGEWGTYEVDTVYFRDEAGANNHHGAILVSIEANTRYAYARPMVMKADAKNRGIRKHEWRLNPF